MWLYCSCLRIDLYNKYHDDGLEILAFPCNQFGEQEPGMPGCLIGCHKLGTSEEIKKFVSKFGVTFPLFSKIDVNGPNEHPLFTFLKNNQEIAWNFEKFLCNVHGSRSNVEFVLKPRESSPPLPN